MHPIPALLVLLVAPWPLWRVCTSRRFRRHLPRLGRRLTALLAAYLLAVAATAVILPAALAPLAVAAVVVALAERWRARPDYGRGRGLPPGSLGVLPLDLWLERDYLERQFARFGPIVKVHPVLRPVVCVRGLGRGLDLLTRGTDELVPIPLGFSRFITGGFVRYMDGETHRHHRQQFQRALSADVVARNETTVRELFDDAFDRMAGDGSVAPEPYVQAAVFAAWMRLFFGIDRGTRAFEELRALYRVIDVRNPLRASEATVRDAIGRIRSLLAAEARAGRAANRSFLAALEQAVPGAVDDPTAIENLIFMTHTSWSDVSGLLFWVCKMLGDHPAWIARVREADGATGGELATRIVLETLRLAQMEHLYRKAGRAVRLDGFVIPKGWLVRICVRESHLDEAIFADARTFDPDRFRARTYAPSEFTPFGLSTHGCLGQQLTLTTGRLFVVALARGFDVTLTADGPPEFSSWLHWHPSPALRLRLTRQVAAP